MLCHINNPYLRNSLMYLFCNLLYRSFMVLYGIHMPPFFIKICQKPCNHIARISGNPDAVFHIWNRQRRNSRRSFQYHLRILQNGFPINRWRNAFSTAFKQRSSQLMLQRTDRFADIGLGGIHTGCSLGQTSPFTGNHKKLQLFNIHIIFLSSHLICSLVSLC